MPGAFLDTNVLVYIHERDQTEKRQKAERLLRDEIGNLVISTQVLQELYVTTTKKLGLSPLVAKRLVGLYGKLRVVVIRPSHIDEAIDCSIVEQISFWDALIVVAARAANCATLYTEDLNDGQILRGVRVRNPFR